MRKAYLILSDGSVYEGESFGAEKTAVGELVFQTGVVGYLETLTDPCYAGQLVLQTFPLIGNYGVIEADFDGECALHGYVVREWCDAPSNFRSQYPLDELLKSKGIPGICGVDTRAITRKIRDHGVMNAMITTEIPADLSALQSFSVTGKVEATTCREREFHPAEGEAKVHAALIDYGARHGFVRELQSRGCDVTIWPAFTPAEEILSENPDGVLLSNGPGDPAENEFCIAQIQKLLGKAPLFGAGLGHQMTAIAAGGKTEKMKYGHRGANQPVRENSCKNTYITSQNHGYVVVTDSLATGAIRFVNANDGSCEGVDYPQWDAFTVQFLPETGSGPLDTGFLFDRFVSLMEKHKTGVND